MYNMETNDEIDYSNPLSEWIGKDVMWLPNIHKHSLFCRDQVKLLAVYKKYVVIEETYFEGYKYMGIYPYRKLVFLKGPEYIDPSNWVEYQEFYPGPEREEIFLQYLLMNRL